MAQHHPTGSETTPPCAPRSSRFVWELPSVEDDVDIWFYAIRVACQKRRWRTKAWQWHCLEVTWVTFSWITCCIDCPQVQHYCLIAPVIWWCNRFAMLSMRTNFTNMSQSENISTRRWPSVDIWTSWHSVQCPLSASCYIITCCEIDMSQLMLLCTHTFALISDTQTQTQLSLLSWFTTHYSCWYALVCLAVDRRLSWQAVKVCQLQVVERSQVHRELEVGVKEVSNR